MARYFGFVRFAIVWLVVLLIGRLVLGATGVPYAQGTWFFSMVLFAVTASLLFGGFSRRMGFRWYQGLLVGTSIGLSAQVLIFLATVLSYLLGASTYFNAPGALNVDAAIPLGQAIGVRLGGLVFNTILDSLFALIGWSMGKLIPERP